MKREVEKTYEDGLRAALALCRAVEAKANAVGTLEEIAEDAAAACGEKIEKLLLAATAQTPRNTVTFTLAEERTPYNAVPNGCFFAFVSDIDGISLCYKNANGTFQYITLGRDDADACPSMDCTCACHPNNTVRIATLTRSAVSA